MTDQELDLLMKRILVDSIKLEMELDVTDSAASFKPSPHHQRQMKAMLKNPLNWLRKKTRPMWKNIIHKAAMILLIISLGFGTLMISRPTVRATFVRWITEWYENYIVYRYSGDNTNDEIPKYEIEELPEGFVESERAELSGTTSITYENEFGDVIYFEYVFIAQGGANVFNTEDSNVFDIEVNHMSGQFYESKVPGNFNTITWIDTEQNTQFNISGTHSYIDILHMAESVSLVKTPK